MSEWKEYKIGDIGNFSYGKMPKKDKLNKGNYPTFSGYKYQYKYPEINCRKNDLIVVARGVGGTGDVKIVKEDCYLTNLSLKMDFNKDIVDNIFIYYYYSIDTLRYLDSGSAQSQITIKDLSDAFISLPPLKEQKAIAEVLSSLDDKIDLLHCQNKTLEEMAQTLFRQWFIEEAKDEWEEKPLKDFCIKITKGTTPTTLKKQFIDSGINFIKVNCIDDNGNYLKDKFNFIDEETNELLNRSQLQTGDILYSIAGTIGRISVVLKDILPANVNQALAIIRVDKSKINPNYIRYCIQDKNITFELHSKIVHAVQPNLSLGEISNTLIPLPDENTLNKFSLLVNTTEEKIAQNKQQIKTLENMRDTLLPKLMSGEVRVNYD
ncbi:MAG: restriction endonuclease subunit S [Sulfurovum sp.]|nr:restriction endonuclease subunit S [Sulfurovum sp.]